MPGMNRHPALRLRISLEGIEPSIWRTVIFPRNATLHELHRAIQILFGWYDYHLYQFEIDSRCFEAPDEEAEGEDSTRTRLSKLITGPGQVFHYVYDFGDNWIHRIEVEDDDVSADPGWTPWLVDGEWRGPPEDCGGVSGYQRLVEAINAPPETLDEEGRDFVRWGGDGFDPEEFSVSQARHALLLSAAWGCLEGRSVFSA